MEIWARPVSGKDRSILDKTDPGELNAFVSVNAIRALHDTSLVGTWAGIGTRGTRLQPPHEFLISREMLG